MSLLADPLTSALLEYYQGLTHACSTALQLAGKLEKQLSTSKNTSKDRSLKEQHVSLSQGLSNFSSFYSDIISKMVPLWKLIHTDKVEDNVKHRQEEQESHKLEDICKSLMEFHSSVLASGASLFVRDSPSDAKEHIQASKGSPYIVITDTAKGHTPPVGLLSASSATRIESATGMGRIGDSSQLPTDQDMDTIINFLSSTFTCKESTAVDENLQTAARSSSSAAFPQQCDQIKKLALSNHRSSPLPGQSERAAEHTGFTSETKSVTRYHSDYQLYTPNKSGYDGQEGMPPSVYDESSRSSSLLSVGLPREVDNQYHSQLPFGGWSHNSHNIWAQESTGSSGDESGTFSTPVSAAQQFYNPTPSPDTTNSLLNSARRLVLGEGSEGDRHGASMVNPHFQNLHQSHPLSSAGAWSSSSPLTMSQCWYSSTQSNMPVTGPPYPCTASSATSMQCSCHQCSIWKPMDLDLSTRGASKVCPSPPPPTLPMVNSTIDSAISHAKIKQSHSNLF